MGFFKEFREFAIKGNAIDMAVGLIIGAAFGNVVQSIVNDMVMPVCGYMLSKGEGATDFKDMRVILAPAKAAIAETPAKDGHPAVAAVAAVPEVAIRYGMFINTILNFLIVALTVFIMIKAMNKMLAARGNLVPFMRQDKPTDPAAPAPPGA